MDDTVFLGRVEVRPPLNEAERGYLRALAESTSTLRGTPTGRGDSKVPFAHLAWEACESGCCLTWNGTERAEHLTASLRFVVDHLFRPGAKVAGHRRFPEFTCDHVLDGVVAGRGRAVGCTSPRSPPIASAAPRASLPARRQARRRGLGAGRDRGRRT